MYSAESLNIQGYGDEPVPNTFFKQDTSTDRIAILLPGWEYTCQMPLLYYPARLLLHLGWDALQVEYTYNLRHDFQAASPSEQLKWLFADAEAAFTSAMAQRDYSKVALIGKSIGTLAMGELLTTQAKLAQARAVWLTPLFRNERLKNQINQCRQPSLFVIGTADPNYTPTIMAEAKEYTGGEAVVIEGADHSLEIKDNIPESLKALRKVIDALERFLK